MVKAPAVGAVTVSETVAVCVIPPPVADTVMGIAWMQALAWRVRGVKPAGVPAASPLYAAAALLALLLLFQLVLRPGIRL